MMTETVPATTALHRWTVALPIGLFGGLALGVIARLWMRFISDEPEFSWGGTLAIVLGFGMFGLAQATVAVARTRSLARWKLTLVRAIGVIFTLPLFGAAGALMFPFVLGAGLAVARTNWRIPARVIWLLIAVGPVVFVATDLADSFGWSFRTFAGLAAMLGIYSVIVWCTRFTIAPQNKGSMLQRVATAGFN